MESNELLARAEKAAEPVQGRRRIGARLSIAVCVAGGLLAVPVAQAAPAEAAVSHNPTGHLDLVEAHDNRTVSVAGWAFDPDHRRGSVRVSVDGRVTTVATTLRRSAVNRHFRQAPKLTGFATTIGTLGYGQHRVCVTAVNRGPGASTPLGCSTISFVNPHNPRGSATFRLRARTVSFRGTAVDPDVPGTPIRLQYVLDGRVRSQHFTDANGRFSGSWTLPYGRHTVAIRAFNLGAGDGNPIVVRKRIDVSPPMPAANKVVAKFAAAQVGKAYSGGGIGPNAYDCSGLSLAAYARAGLRLPHNAQAQYAMFRRISQSQAKPGDLVFFHSAGGGAVYHVAVVAPGKNMIYSAADYGIGVVHKPNKYAASRLNSAGWPTSSGAVVVTYGTITHQ